MSFYCLCEANNDKPDSQAFGAPNRYCKPTDDVPDFPSLALRVPMVCIKTGAVQVLLNRDQNKGNDWSGQGRPEGSRHYPNVDVFECPNCHARIIRE